jgi:hypothetical protein
MDYKMDPTGFYYLVYRCASLFLQYITRVFAVIHYRFWCYYSNYMYILADGTGTMSQILVFFNSYQPAVIKQPQIRVHDDLQR